MAQDVVPYCGVGNSNVPKPGDPDNNISLFATPAFQGILVRWTYPALNPYSVAHVIVYRSSTAIFEQAIQLAIVTGDRYFDAIEDVQKFYYWIRIVSVHGTEGALRGPVSATSRELVSDIIQRITERIDNGVLAISLREDISKISIINDALFDEIFDRETGETSLSQAIQDAQNGVAQALTFIATETNSRVTENAALAEAINVVAATGGENAAAAITSLQAWVDNATGELGAMYTAKVQVNGLIGGFGVWNNGDEVQAGFDVDTFWVGRTGPDQVKPFIVQGGTVYMSEAMIASLTFDKLVDSSGGFIVEGGKIKADKITVDTASIENAAITGAKIEDAAITTLKIGAYQVTAPASAYTAGDVVMDYTWTALQSITFTATGQPIFINFSCSVDDAYTWNPGYADNDDVNDVLAWEVSINGLSSGEIKSSTGSLTLVDTPSAGTYTYTVYGRTISSNHPGSPKATASQRSLFMLETKR